MVPDHIGRYEINGELGQGGMASVYRGYDPLSKRQVAVKVLPRDLLHDPSFRARFARESETIASLEHPAIVPVYDFGEDNGQPYIVMRLMNGGSLRDRLESGPLPLPEAARILTALAPALDRAHAKGIIHRDLKPGNILFDEDGNPYLADFGIARLAEGNTVLTGTTIIGTPAYMSPEQARGEKDVDARSDLYSMGIIVYQMLTGQLPFDADNALGMAMHHVNTPIPSARDLRPDLPRTVEDIIKRAMAKRREARYGSAAGMAQDLATLTGGGKAAAPPKPKPAVTAKPAPAPPVRTKQPQANTINAMTAGLSEAARSRPRVLVGSAVFVGLGVILLVVLLVLVFALPRLGSLLQRGTATSVVQSPTEALAVSTRSATGVPPTSDAEVTSIANLPTDAPVTPEVQATAPTDTGPALKMCEVTDTGGVDDKSFNQTAWEGAQIAAADYGWEATFLESQQQTDYEKNINEFVQSDCELIVTVGFLLGDATLAAAKANPDQKIQILDFAYAEELPNVWQQVYATDQAAFLAGYVAASVTKTGKVGTFGGINIPPVVDFMDGFAFGVAYYNEQKGTNVEVLGWDPADREGGLFTGNFDSTDDGRRLAETLMDEGADIILPVAGPVGLGSAAAIQERGDAWMVGVDADMRLTAPEFAGIFLTSVLKKLDVTVAEAVAAIDAGTFTGGVHVASLENKGVDITTDSDLISAETLAELDAIRAGIIDGSIPTKPAAP